MSNTNIDGHLAFFDPIKGTWLPLDMACYQLMYPEKEDGSSEQIENNKSHIQNILSNALKTPNINFFAGSGTSLGEVGGPSMWDLWRKCMWISPECQKTEADYGVLHKAAEQVLKTVNYSSEETNIEHFLSHCEAYLQFNENASVSDYVRDVKETILFECSNFILPDFSNISAYKTLLQKLARRRVRDPRLNVFTTNYDMCFESAASSLGMMLIDGFSYTRKRYFNGKYFDYDVVSRNDDNHEFVEGVIKLHKLHGSVSWERIDGNIVENEDVEPDSASLIYPAKGKYQQAFIQPYLELLSRFLDTLRKPNSCLLISGFGFNDDHLSEPILSAITSNPSLKLIIADFSAKRHVENAGENGSSSYWGKFSELASHGYDIHLLNCSFSGLVSLIPNLKALTPAESLAKAITLVGKGDF